MRRSPLKWLVILGVIVMALSLAQILVEIWKLLTF